MCSLKRQKKRLAEMEKKKMLRGLQNLRKVFLFITTYPLPIWTYFSILTRVSEKNNRIIT